MGQPDEERRRPALQPAASFAVRALLAGFVFVVTGRLANRRAEPRVSACNGFTQPYDGIKLNGEQLEQLDAGRKLTLSKREAGVGGGRGTAVCDIAAPPKEIWKTILDFDHYKGRLAQCKYSTVYERKKNVMSRTETIKVHMKLDGIIRDFNCYYDHTFKPDKNELTCVFAPRPGRASRKQRPRGPPTRGVLAQVDAGPGEGE
ncbi:hypothetical protein M885DRAFT_305657 [Pelagophyceae sp. CCMP2097]|nr:hypothetical protein M885DRAFT_305657 [Pelagophyceae sp. CCMP2097]